MEDKEDQNSDDAYDSDGGETEDEEVKRNCIMGESGMRDSDYFDSDTDVEEEEEEETEEQIDDKRNDAVEEDRIVQLVKFVSVGSQILKPKGITLFRPTPIVLVTAMNGENPDAIDESSSASSPKIKLSVSHDDSASGFSPRLESNGEIPISASSGSDQDSDTDSNDGDVESIDSEDDTKTSSFDFPFGEEVELSLEIGTGITSTPPDGDDSCCKQSLDDQDEDNEEYALVGASGASVDDKWQMPKQKRVLSSNTLSTLNQEAGHNESQAKRTRLGEHPSEVSCAIPEIKLCTEALDEIIQPLPRQFLVRDDSSLIHSSSDEEEDKVLSEELEERFRCKRISVANFPIPLLTPPQSPRTVDSTVDDDDMRTIEWPSNLVMDNTIINGFTNVSPISTISKMGNGLKIDASVGDTAPRRLGPRIRTISVECRDVLL